MTVDSYQLFSVPIIVQLVFEKSRFSVLLELRNQGLTLVNESLDHIQAEWLASCWKKAQLFLYCYVH